VEAPGLPTKEDGMADPGDKRLAQRQPVLKVAKILYGGSVVDALVLDASASGVRISTETFVAFPEQVTVELRTGGVWAAIRRWQRGTETGFEFTHFAGLHAEGAASASRLYDQLRNTGVRDVTARLAAERHFDHAELRVAADALLTAMDRLEHLLRIAAGRG
jgi:hypothetical protein